MNDQVSGDQQQQQKQKEVSANHAHIRDPPFFRNLDSRKNGNRARIQRTFFLRLTVEEREL